MEPDNEKTSVVALGAKRGLGRFPVLSPGDEADAYRRMWAWAFAGSPVNVGLRIGRPPVPIGVAPPTGGGSVRARGDPAARGRCGRRPRNPCPRRGIGPRRLQRSRSARRHG